MKKLLSLFFAILTFSIGYAQDFTVHKYAVDIYLHEEGYFDVIENYDLTFDIHKHGIYRTIQTKYDLVNSKGIEEKRKIKITNIEVPNYKFDAPFEFIQKINDKMDIKIGDEDITLIGPQQYEIKYRVSNAFLFEDSQVQFYWNIKPDGWLSDFHKIEFEVHLPEGVEVNQENCFVYTGTRGTDTPSTDIRTSYDYGVFSGTSIDNFVSRPGQSVTVLIKLPAQSIKENKPLWPFWNNYGWSFIIAAIIAAFYFVWMKFGKDDRVVSITSYYPPDNIDPAMAGFLINDREDNSDLISLIPYWGSQGLLMIEDIPKKGFFGSKDTKLTSLKRLPSDAPDYEQEIFKGLFGYDDNSSSVEVLVSSLKNTFYTKMASARSTLKEKGQLYYEAKSKKVQGITWGILVALAILFTWLGLIFWGLIAAGSILLTCIILMFVNVYMIKKNAKGNQLFSELKGFRKFIKVAEENKLKMLLKDDPGYFETTMGYALAFGLFEKWAKKFDALNLPPPTWYVSTYPHNHSMNNFSQSFSSSMSGMTSNMVSSPSSSGSSGGGSSGGGFGGGGGGSW